MAKVYCLDQHNNYVETMTKEEIIAAIQTAAEGGKLEGFSNCAVVTQIKELNRNGSFSVWVGTQAEYNALAEKANNVLYLFEDDPMCSDLPNKVEQLVLALNDYDKVIQQQRAALTDHATKLEENKNAIDAQREESKNAIDAQGVKITEHDEQLAALKEQINGAPKVGFTRLWSGSEANYETVSGISLSANYDAFDFVYIEFERSGKEYRNVVAIPTFNIVTNKLYRLMFAFGGTNGYVSLRFSADSKKKIYFSDGSVNDLQLVAVYGYMRKGGA